MRQNKPNCFLCGASGKAERVPKGRTAREPVISHEEVMNAWMERCVVSTCRILRIPGGHPGMEVLLRAEKYCGSCVQVMRDVEFSVGAMDKLQRQIRSLRQTLINKLNAHWNLQHSPEHNAAARRKKIPNGLNPPFAVVFEKVHEELSSWTDVDFLTFETAQRDANKPDAADIKADPIVNEVLELIKEEPYEQFDFVNYLHEDNEESNMEFLGQEISHLDTKIEELGISATNEMVDEEAICTGESPSGSKISQLPKPKHVESCQRSMESIAFELLEKKTELAACRPMENTEKRGITKKLSHKAKTKLLWIKTSINQQPKKLKVKSRRRISCPDGCAQKFNSRISLREHVRQTHNGIYTCNQCDKKLVTLDGYNKHLKAHVRGESKKGQKTCGVCGIWLKLEEVEEHEGQHRSREFPFSCLICDDTKFLGAAPLKKHMKVVHPSEGLICHECGRVYGNPHSLKRHISTIHSKHIQNYECSDCGKVFPQYFLLKRHKYSYHSASVCDLCGKSYTNATSLQHHKRMMHSSDSPYKCPICDKRFKSSKGLAKHQQIHAGVTFQCPDCPKTFATKRYLSQHARCHLPRELRKYYYKTIPTSTHPADAPDSGCTKSAVEPI